MIPKHLIAILYFRLFGNGLAYFGPFWWGIGEWLQDIAGNEAIQSVPRHEQRAWRFMPSPWLAPEDESSTAF